MVRHGCLILLPPVNDQPWGGKTWDHPEKKNFKVTPSAGKLVATVLWGSSGVLLVDFLKHGRRVNFDKLRASLISSRCHHVKTSPSSYWWFDSLPRHPSIAHGTSQPEAAAKFRLENGGPSGYGTRRFSSCFLPWTLDRISSADDADVKDATIMWLTQQGRKSYASRMDKLTTRCDKYLNRQGDDGEKQCTSSYCIVYCQRPRLKVCLLFMDNLTLLPEPPSYSYSSS
jgi:hypothetical protein